MAGRSRAARELLKALRNRLIRAVEDGELADPIAHVFDLLRVAHREGDEVIEVPPGPRNRDHDPALPHFTRDDGAWFDFGVILRHGTVISWTFELRFPDPEVWKVPWIRFDLNPPGHDNDLRGLRCHVHLGSNDDGMAIPYPLPGGEPPDPVTVLDLILRSLRATGRSRRR